MRNSKDTFAPMRICLLCIATLGLLLTGNAVYSQAIFRGVVLDAFNKKPMYPVSVVNLTTGKTTLSVQDGSFAITAQTGELIQYSFLGYTTKRAAVPFSSATLLHTVLLEPEDFQLKEFVFRQKYTPYQLDSLYRAGTYSKDLGYRRSGGVMSPVSLLAETLSGKARSMKNFKKDYQFWEQQHFIDSRYTDALVAEQTGLRGDSIALFKNQYLMRYDFARAASGIEIKMWVRNNFKEWRTKGSPGIKASVADSILRIER